MFCGDVNTPKEYLSIPPSSSTSLSRSSSSRCVEGFVSCWSTQNRDRQRDRRHGGPLNWKTPWR